MLSVVKILIIKCVLLMSTYHHYLNIVVLCGYHRYAAIQISLKMCNELSLIGRLKNVIKRVRLYYNRLVFLKQYILFNMLY